MSAAPTGHPVRSRALGRSTREARLALAYVAAYVGYLFLRLEGERLHWLSLVLVPVGLVWLTRRTWLAIVATSILFGFYHLPYAYLHPRWPSHGQ